MSGLFPAFFIDHACVILYKTRHSPPRPLLAPCAAVDRRTLSFEEILSIIHDKLSPMVFDSLLLGYPLCVGFVGSALPFVSGSCLQPRVGRRVELNLQSLSLFPCDQTTGLERRIRTRERRCSNRLSDRLALQE